MNRVPGFINGLKKCVNSSMNCSFTSPTPALSFFSNKRRDIFNLKRSSSTSSSGTAVGYGGPVVVAAAIHGTFGGIPSPDITA